MSGTTCLSCIYVFGVYGHRSFPFTGFRNVLLRRTSYSHRLAGLRSSNRVYSVSEPLGGSLNYKEAQGRTGVGSYFKRHEVALTHCHWQVLNLPFLKLKEYCYSSNHLSNFLSHHDGVSIDNWCIFMM